MNGLDPGALLTYGVVIIALVIGARGALQRSTIAALKEQNDAFAKREAAREKEKAREDAEREKEKANNAATFKRLGDRNTYLEELVLRAGTQDRLAELMTKHDDDAARRHADSIKLLRSVNSHLADMDARTAVEKRETRE